MKTYGLRDIIGPVMVGPSSSHTAGALRIASIARKLFGATPRAARFTLYGSFAATGSGHGTDKALVAGIIGLNADDPNVSRSFELADKADTTIDIVWDTATSVDHPNTVDVHCEDLEGRSLDMRGVSIGGGAAVIRRINGIDVDITGEHTSVVVHQHDAPGVLAHISSVLANCGINIATANLHRTEKRGDAFTVLETDDDVDGTVRDYLMLHPSILDARVIPAMSATDGAPIPIPDDADETFARWNYTSGSELLALCEREGATIAQVFRAREEALCAKQGMAADVDAYLDRVLEVMDKAATGPIAQPERSIGGLMGYTHEELREGILTAAAVGYVIARNASVSGAEGGCQAEVGSAAAMAAAAAVAMAHGTPTQALDAASNVIQSLLGLVCDPVGGLVELPCQKRDATAAPMALVCAQIALSGVSNLVPFDENVAVMDKVGRDLPSDLRETARGGIAIAPSACSFCAGC